MPDRREAFDPLLLILNPRRIEESRRLAAAGVPIVAPKDGWVRHLKTREPEPENEQKRLLVGEIDAEVRLEV